MYNGADGGLTNGAWVSDQLHVIGHSKLKWLERLPLGTEIVPK